MDIKQLASYTDEELLTFVYAMPAPTPVELELARRLADALDDLEVQEGAYDED